MLSEPGSCLVAQKMYCSFCECLTSNYCCECIDCGTYAYMQPSPDVSIAPSTILHSSFAPLATQSTGTKCLRRRQALYLLRPSPCCVFPCLSAFPSPVWVLRVCHLEPLETHLADGPRDRISSNSPRTIHLQLAFFGVSGAVSTGSTKCELHPLEKGLC